MHQCAEDDIWCELLFLALGNKVMDSSDSSYYYIICIPQYCKKDGYIKEGENTKNFDCSQ